MTSRYSNLPSLPLPSPTTNNNNNPNKKKKKSASEASAALRLRYQHLKASGRDEYQRWKRRSKDRYHEWKSRQQERYQAWKSSRRRLPSIHMPVVEKVSLVNEYSKAEWFDDLGRPLTAKDSTGRFVNPWQSQSTNGVHSFGTLANWRVQRLQREIGEIQSMEDLIALLPWKKYAPNPAKSPNHESEPEAIPALPSPEDDTLSATWLGHSTCFIQMNGFTILTDPIFSVRASPYQRLPVGVPRVMPASHSVDELVAHGGSGGDQGRIDVCCITHDHYDHMDQQSVQDLAPYVQLWIVPLGIADWLVDRGNVSRDKIVELEWWQQSHLIKTNETIQVQSTSDDGAMDLASSLSSSTLTITCCPASHWAGRTMWDRNKRLWASFAIVSPTQKVFFCGDTGYPENFPLFRQIGDTLGPFDLSCIPIGAYIPEELNRDAHINPEQAVQVHEDILSKHSMAMHYGSFPLGEEGMDVPPQELQAALEAAAADADAKSMAPFSIIGHGATIKIQE